MAALFWGLKTKAVLNLLRPLRLAHVTKFQPYSRKLMNNMNPRDYQNALQRLHLQLNLIKKKKLHDRLRLDYKIEQLDRKIEYVKLRLKDATRK
ncbi:uncharacterized protein Dmoj_GI26457 [Drosophila mojavensis]|uniref:Uncharacterized protein n=1 Tax=Drosophila mojavensis TaxID=7230 RepID=A0A0Q9XAX2_DROMO|nr:uncharacterized protein Dmoj_GI26457 [Drosophila mojavensis]